MTERCLENPLGKGCHWIYPKPDGIESTAKCKYCDATLTSENSLARYQLDFKITIGDQPRLKDGRDEALLDMWDAGKHPKIIAEKFNIALNTVYFIARKHGRTTSKKINIAERNERIREEFQHGDDRQTLADRYGLGIDSIYRILRGINRNTNVLKSD